MGKNILEIARLFSWVVLPLAAAGALIWLLVWAGEALLFSLAGASLLIVPAILVFLCSFLYPLLGGGKSK